MSQNQDKSDISFPRSYRPTASLSVLDNGLGRLLAKKIDWVTVRNKILTIQQFGALPVRSAVDLTICLMHDIERALNEGLTASMLTLDVEGAFDAVLPSRLFAVYGNKDGQIFQSTGWHNSPLTTQFKSD